MISPWVKNGTILTQYCLLQGSDFWVPSKKYIGDGAFPEKILSMDLAEISQDRIDIVGATYISHPEWDIGIADTFKYSRLHLLLSMVCTTYHRITKFSA